jgi:hypothetical protein
MRNKLLQVTLLACMASSTFGDWAIKGEGNFTCPDYVEARRINSKELYSSISWVQGFVTGVNYQRALEEGADSFIGRDFAPRQMVNWLEDHCRDNPQDYLSDAAQALVKELQGKE